MTRLVVAPGVGVLELDDVVYVAPLPDGPIAVLDGVAAFIWHEGLAGDREDLVATVAAATDGPIDDVRDAVTRFVEDLLAWGWVEVEAGVSGA